MLIYGEKARVMESDHKMWVVNHEQDGQHHLKANIELTQISPIGVLASDAVRERYTLNPFNFQHYNLNYLQVTVDGIPYPRRALEPAYANKLYIDSYLTLFMGTGKWNTNDGNDISRDNYPNGYCLYLFNIDPAKQMEDLVPISKQGNIKVEVRFAQPLPTTVDC